MRRLARVVSSALLPAVATLPAAAAGPPPEHVGGWTVTADPPMPGAGCSMVLRDGGGELLVMLAAGETRIEASSKHWFASGAISYAVHLTVDRDAPVDIAAEGAGPDGLHLLPNAKLPTAPFVERLRSGRTLAVRKEGNPLIETVTFGTADFGAAYARLEACAAGAAGRAEASASTRRERCETLATAAAAALGGKRTAEPYDDRILLDVPDGQVLVTCGTADEAPSLSLSRDGRGIPDGMMVQAGKLAAILASRTGTAFTSLPAACLARVKRYELRRGGKRVARPEGATALFEGEAKAPPVKLSCSYYDAAKLQPSFTVE